MALAPGTRLGPYEILAPIGAGGMGEVYKGRDTRLGRDVAIKLSKEQFTERFDREARAVAALNHSSICHLYDVGPNYLVMELVEGETLGARLAKSPLPTDLVLQYGTQIADALAAAHSFNIIHRDLKPGNIMVTRAGIKVLDFGLAKFTDTAEASPKHAETLTEERAIVGTPAYMAPEQLSGEEVDARTDLFCFGAVLYEMATGQHPFRGDTSGVIFHAILEGTPTSAVRLNPDLPPKTHSIRVHFAAKQELVVGRLLLVNFPDVPVKTDIRNVMMPAGIGATADLDAQLLDFRVAVTVQLSRQHFGQRK